MPPQVGGVGGGSGTIVHETPHSQDQKVESKDTQKTDNASGASKSNETKSTESSPSPKQPEDPKAAARAAHGSKQNAIDKQGQHKVQEQMVQKNLQKQVPAKAGTAYTASEFAADAAKSGIKSVGNSSANQPSTDASGLKKGESISARVTDKKKDGVHFQFERPITKDQAGAIIFQDGKVPENAKLEGSGKNWVVKTPPNAEDRANTLAHFNKRTETIKIPERRPTDDVFPESEVTNTWVGGDLKTTGPRAPVSERRSDLKNDMGFKIKNNYALDPGQHPHEKLGLPAKGYEVEFDKPMTKTQVMDKLFDKEKVDKGGEIRLIPKSKEPASEWKVELIGLDAVNAYKTEPGHAFSKVGRAFNDANLHGKESLPSDTPPGIRSHLENRTIPANAEKLKKPAKDGKDVYVWEQDGYMMYVKTNNKGKDGYYEAEVPTKMPAEKQGQKWMRGYVKEQGMTPGEAWHVFWQDTADVSKGGIQMVSGAARAPQVLRTGKAKSSFDDSPPSSGKPTRSSTSGNAPKGGPPGMPDAPAKPREQWQHVNASNRQGGDSNRIPDPAAVDQRIDARRPPYKMNPAHDKKSPLYNPKKTPEPSDTESLWNSGRVVQEDLDTFYGIGEKGYYRFKQGLEGTEHVHFNGIIDASEVPKKVKQDLDAGKFRFTQK